MAGLPPEAPNRAMPYTFNEHWITETLRLRESLWGPLEDSAESGRARAHGGGFDERLRIRSRLLAHREGLDTALLRWRQIARLVLMLFVLAAVVAGGAAAAGALGNGGRPVNLTLAVAALLGLNTLTFVSWAASFGIQPGVTGSLLTDAWLRLTRKLARGPDAALLPRALLELMTRGRLSRWGAGVLSHGLWGLALLSAFATLLALLAARRYTFQWETTVLSPDTFVALVRALGWLPSLLGFPQPSPDTIRASGSAQALPDSAQALWSAWLLGVVIVYGVIPRLAALALSIVVIRRRLARLAVDPSLPGLAELHDRLMPASVAAGIDAPAPLPGTGMAVPRPALGTQPSRQLLGLELPPDLAWPPGEPAPIVHDLGVVDTREQRHRVLDTLRQAPAERLVVCCDARQTPDRGALAVLTELASLSGGLKLVLLPDDDTPARRAQWRELLMRAGFTLEQLPPRLSPALDWLAEACPDKVSPGNIAPRTASPADTGPAPASRAPQGGDPDTGSPS